jgi:hypothetical protein
MRSERLRGERIGPKPSEERRSSRKPSSRVSSAWNWSRSWLCDHGGSTPCASCIAGGGDAGGQLMTSSDPGWSRNLKCGL